MTWTSLEEEPVGKDSQKGCFNNQSEANGEQTASGGRGSLVAGGSQAEAEQSSPAGEGQAHGGYCLIE